MKATDIKMYISTLSIIKKGQEIECGDFLGGRQCTDVHFNICYFHIFYVLIVSNIGFFYIAKILIISDVFKYNHLINSKLNLI